METITLDLLKRAWKTVSKRFPTLRLKPSGIFHSPSEVHMLVQGIKNPCVCAIGLLALYYNPSFDPTNEDTMNITALYVTVERRHGVPAVSACARGFDLVAGDDGERLATPEAIARDAGAAFYRWASERALVMPVGLRRPLY